VRFALTSWRQKPGCAAAAVHQDLLLRRVRFDPFGHPAQAAWRVEVLD